MKNLTEKPQMSFDEFADNYNIEGKFRDYGLEDKIQDRGFESEKGKRYFLQLGPNCFYNDNLAALEEVLFHDAIREGHFENSERPHNAVFPDFDYDIEPLILQLPGWESTCWKNDSMPSAGKEFDSVMVRLWFDYDNLLLSEFACEREQGQMKKFCLNIDGTGENILDTDEWQEVVQFIEGGKLAAWVEQFKKDNEQEAQADMPDNAPHNALKRAVNRAIAEGSPVFTEITEKDQRRKALNVAMGKVGSALLEVSEILGADDDLNNELAALNVRNGKHWLLTCSCDEMAHEWFGASYQFEVKS